ncbi:MAG: cyanophycinase [Massilia sp.]|nr:cyanophycinase [Massilia sp.]
MLATLRFAAIAWMLAAATLAHAADKGSLVIIGGALRADNAVVWERIVQLAGGKGARIAVFPSAAGNPERSAKTAMAYLTRYGASPFLVPLSPKLPDYRKLADDPALAARVAGAGGAYFVGGDQARITGVLRREDGSDTLVLGALWTTYRGGGVIAGTSAGAAVMSSTMFDNAKGVLDTLRLGVRDGAEIAPGLGFAGDDVFIDQHLIIRGRFARMLPLMLKKGYRYGIGVDENTAIVLAPAREVEVIGYKGVIVLDLTTATTGAGAFNIANAKISYLDHGDRFNLASHAFIPGPDKTEGLIDAADPSNRGRLFSAYILGNTTVVDLLTKLIDSDQESAIGLAFGDPQDPQAQSGFEFRFSRVKDSVGYASASSEAASIYNVRLDVRPIRLRLPLYEY